MIDKTKKLVTSILEHVSTKTKNLSSGKTKIRIERDKSAVVVNVTTQKKALTRGAPTPKPVVIVINATKTSNGHKVNKVSTNFMGENKYLQSTLISIEEILIKLINKEG